MKLTLLARLAGADEIAEPSIGAIEIGRDVGAVLQITPQLNRTTPAAQATSEILLAANADRLAAIVLNTGTTVLHLIEPPAFGSSGAPQQRDIAVGKEWQSPSGVYDAIFGWWDTLAGGGAPTGTATVTEIVPVFGAVGGGGGGGSSSVSVTSLPATPAGSSHIGGVNVDNAVTTSDGGAAVTGATMPAGGSGLTGWLSAIWSRLANIATLSFSGSNLNVNVAGGSMPFNTYTVASGAAAAANVKGGPAWLFGVLVTTAGSAGVGLSINDSTTAGTGTQIAAVAPNAQAGWIPFPQPVHFQNGCYVNATAGSPAVTVSTS